jgi:hypothetical protein
MKTYEFSMYLRVHDDKELLEAARLHPDAAGMATEEFYDEDGEVDIRACLTILLDPGSLPGCEILDSTIEGL